MPVKKDALGQHRVEMEWLVPGTPEQVWEALATGPGISAWFARANIEPKIGGKLEFVFGEGVTSSGTVTGWEPPRRFAYEERGWSEKDPPPVATEIAVTARSGGTCLVRMVHSLFATSDDWDDQLEGFEGGWPGYFEVLRLYLTHFPGQSGVPTRVACTCAASEADVWQRFTQSLGFAGANVGDRLRAPEGAPPLGGVVERIHQDHRSRELHVRLDQPAPGVALLSTYSLAGQTHAVLGAYFYGDRAEEHARRHVETAKPWLARLLDTR